MISNSPRPPRLDFGHQVAVQLDRALAFAKHAPPLALPLWRSQRHALDSFGAWTARGITSSVACYGRNVQRRRTLLKAAPSSRHGRTHSRLHALTWERASLRQNLLVISKARPLSRGLLRLPPTVDGKRG